MSRAVSPGVAVTAAATPGGRLAPVVSRRDVLVRPASAAAVAGAVAVIVLGGLAGVRGTGAGAAWSVGAAVALVLAFSGLTGWLMTAVAGARPEMLLAVALASYVSKVTVFGLAAVLIAGRSGFSAPAFALGGTVALVAWLVTEVLGVLRSPALRNETFPGPR